MSDDGLTSEESGAIPLAPGVWLSWDDVRVQFARSGGPGGQNVNKLNTKIEMWIPMHAIRGMDESSLARLKTLAGRRITRDGLLHLSAQTERTQERNRQAVVERLQILIAEAMKAPRPRKRTRPSKAAKRRRLESKRHRSQIKATRRGALD